MPEEATKRSAGWLLAIQCALVIALLVVAPLVFDLTLFEDIHKEGVYRADQTADPLYPRRIALIFFGLACGLTSILMSMLVLLGRRCLADMSLSIGLALLACVIGWRWYVYSATGALSVMNGTAPRIDMDPFPLLSAFFPARWLDDLWCVSILLLYAVSFFAVPLLAFTGVFVCVRRKQWGRGIATLPCVAGTLAAYAWPPKFLYWFLD
jgi:hypothetical protein